MTSKAATVLLAAVMISVPGVLRAQAPGGVVPKPAAAANQSSGVVTRLPTTPSAWTTCCR